MPVTITPYFIAERFIGQSEVPGAGDNPQLLAMLRLDVDWPQHDEVPWCSAFVNYCAWLLRLPRSKSLMAKSWLSVGEVVDLHLARSGYDVVVLHRGAPGAVTGHVGFFSGLDTRAGKIHLLGGNQGNQVSVAPYAIESVLGVRRLG